MPRIAIILLLALGLIVGVYMVKNQQTTTKSQASSSIVSSFIFKDANGNTITCQEDTTDHVPVCVTPTLNVTAALKTDPISSN